MHKQFGIYTYLVMHRLRLRLRLPVIVRHHIPKKLTTRALLWLAWLSIGTILIARLVDGESAMKFSGRGRGMLFPRESESRQIQLLDGMWNFRADRSDCRCESLTHRWYLKPLSEVIALDECSCMLL